MQTLSSQMDKIPKYDTKNHNAPIPAPGKAISSIPVSKNFVSAERIKTGSPASGHTSYYGRTGDRYMLPQYFPDAFQPFGERLAGAGDVDAQEPFSSVHFAFVDPYVPLLQ